MKIKIKAEVSNVGHLRASFPRSHITRRATLYLFITILIGNLLCDLGNLLAKGLGLKPHYFNIWFLYLGLVGMCYFGIALYRRRNHNNENTLDKLEK